MTDNSWTITLPGRGHLAQARAVALGAAGDDAGEDSQSVPAGHVGALAGESLVGIPAVELQAMQLAVRDDRGPPGIQSDPLGGLFLRADTDIADGGGRSGQG